MFLKVVPCLSATNFWFAVLNSWVVNVLPSDVMPKIVGYLSAVGSERHKQKLQL